MAAYRGDLGLGWTTNHRRVAIRDGDYGNQTVEGRRKGRKKRDTKKRMQTYKTECNLNTMEMLA